MCRDGLRCAAMGCDVPLSLFSFASSRGNMHLREEGRQGTFRMRGMRLAACKEGGVRQGPPAFKTKTTRYATLRVLPSSQPADSQRKKEPRVGSVTTGGGGIEGAVSVHLVPISQRSRLSRTLTL
eukprot:scaffold112291_cov57-Phaeocystis_antarctica.AAC.1